MSKRLFNIVRPREYTGSDGQVKTAWDRHGVLIVDGPKLSIHLDSIPAGEWNGWLNVFERQEEQAGQTPHAQGGHGAPAGQGAPNAHGAAPTGGAYGAGFGPNDDIPF